MPALKEGGRDGSLAGSREAVEIVNLELCGSWHATAWDCWGGCQSFHRGAEDTETVRSEATGCTWGQESPYIIIRGALWVIQRQKRKSMSSE
jgi:hypothetical protein